MDNDLIKPQATNEFLPSSFRSYLMENLSSQPKI